MTAGTAAGPTLAGLGDEERYERFDRLQDRMRGVWEIMRHNEEDESVVVVPSLAWTGSASEVARCSRRMRSGCLCCCCCCGSLGCA